MDLTLTLLLALPFLVAGLIVGVSSVRRRHRAGTRGSTAEPVHRLQAETAEVQDAREHRPVDARKARSGRARRAASASRPR